MMLSYERLLVVYATFSFFFSKTRGLLTSRSTLELLSVRIDIPSSTALSDTIHPPLHATAGLTTSEQLAPVFKENVFKSTGSLQALCEKCVVDSRKKFSEGSNYHSNAKEQMGTWVDQEILSDVLQTVNDTGIVEGSDLAAFLMASPLPIATSIFEGDGYAMNVISIPGGGQRVLMRNYEPGVVLVCKPLKGQGIFKAFNNRRVIQNDRIGHDGIYTLASPSFLRLGGPKRDLESSSPDPCLLLELAFFPKKDPAESSNANSESSLSTDAASKGPTVDGVSIMTLKPPIQVIESGMFESESVALSKSSRLEEERMFLTKNADKYDILNKISRRVGGLSDELGDIVRRVLSSRQLSPQVLKALGLSHVKGVLLYGPPGTGKTLIAREMAKALNSREPILVNGPEIMDKYVGEAERKIRDLFSAAEEEWEVKGKDSELHVIIFDEFDAIAKNRGSFSGDGSGVRDSCVNQLLTKLDGVEETNNVLVVALTNRKDLIDPALLRPGRLEVHMEIRAPDLQGREEILFMLFKSLVKGGFVSPGDAEAWALLLAQRSFGWTGAELSGLMRSAASFAIERSLASTQSNSLQITWEDVDKALKETSKTIPVSKRAAIRNFLRTGAERLRLIKPAGSSRSSGSYVKRKRREFEEILAEEDDWSNPWDEKQPSLKEEKDGVEGNHAAGVSETMSGGSSNSGDSEDTDNSENRNNAKPSGYGNNIGGTIMF